MQTPGIKEQHYLLAEHAHFNIIMSVSLCDDTLPDMEVLHDQPNSMFYVALDKGM